MKDNQPKLDGVPLFDFLETILRTDQCKSLNHLSYLAEVIESKLKSSGCKLYHIQWPDRYSPELELPVLWRYNEWTSWHEKIDRDRARSEEERVKKYIFDENVKRVARKVAAFFEMDEDHAAITAFGMVKNNRVAALKQVGAKLVTTREEI